MKKIFKTLICSCCVLCIGVLCSLIYIKFNSDKIINSGSVMKISNIYPQMSIQEMTDRAEVIVKGRITDISKGKLIKPDDKNASQTPKKDVVFKIREIFKGTPYDEKEIKIRVNSNEYNNIKYEYDSTDDYKIKKNNEYILYLMRDDSDLKTDEDYYVIIQETKGLFLPLINSQDSSWINNDTVLTVSQIKDMING